MAPSTNSPSLNQILTTNTNTSSFLSRWYEWCIAMRRWRKSLATSRNPEQLLYNNRERTQIYSVPTKQHTFISHPKSQPNQNDHASPSYRPPRRHSLLGISKRRAPTSRLLLRHLLQHLRPQRRQPVRAVLGLRHPQRRRRGNLHPGVPGRPPPLLQHQRRPRVHDRRQLLGAGAQVPVQVRPGRQRRKLPGQRTQRLRVRVFRGDDGHGVHRDRHFAGFHLRCRVRVGAGGGLWGLPCSGQGQRSCSDFGVSGLGVRFDRGVVVGSWGKEEELYRFRQISFQIIQRPCTPDIVLSFIGIPCQFR